MTADRPPELHGGRRQPDDRTSRISSVVSSKWFHDTGVPVMAPHERIRWLTAGIGAIQHAVRFPPPGPVHLNLPFREPLLPTGSSVDAFGGERASKTYTLHASIARSDAGVSA